LRHGEQPISSLIPQPLPATLLHENSFDPDLAQKILAKAVTRMAKIFLEFICFIRIERYSLTRRSNSR